MALLLPSLPLQSANAAAVEVSNFAGFGGAGGEDGPANVAKFNQPRDVIIKNDIAYVVDRNGIRQIGSNGAVTTLYRFSGAPLGTNYCSINIDRKDTLWVVACDGSSLTRVSKSGENLGTIRISSSQGWVGYPHSAAFLSDGRLLVPVWYEGKIFAVSEDGSVAPYFRNTNEVICGGSNATRTASTLCPFALAVNNLTGDVYFAHSGSTNNGLYRIQSATTATKLSTSAMPQALRYVNNSVYHATLLGASPNKTFQISRVDSNQNSVQYASLALNPRWLQSGFDLDSKGNIYLPLHESHVVMVYRSSGELIQTIGNAGYGNRDGEKSKATFYRPSGLAEAENGDIYVKEIGGIRKISPAGQVSTVHLSSAIWNDGPMYLRNGRLYYIDNSNYLVSLDPSTGSVRSEYLVTAQPEYLANGRNFAFDSKGNMYALINSSATDYVLGVRKYSSTGTRQNLTNISIASGVNTSIFVDAQDNITIAQSGQFRQYDTNGTPLSASGLSSFFGNDPQIVFENGRPRFVLSTDFRTYTLASNNGNAQELILSGPWGGSNNQGQSSSFFGAKDMIKIKNGDLLVADADNNIIRRISVQDVTSTATGKWQPRPLTSVPRPAELLPGLSQTTFNTYFDDKFDVFTAPPSDARIVESLPVWSDYDKPNQSFEWTGYFIPDFSGSWTFRLTSDDSSYLWIGNNAVASFRNNPSSAVVSLPGQHAEISGVGIVNLTKDKVYPLRINYGNWQNTLAVFKLEFKAPGFNDFETNFRSLIWHSPPGNCTNWGISYVLANTLGTEKFVIPNGCNSGTSASAVTKPNTPTFSGVNFSGNKMNIAVNIGSSTASQPDKIYLVAPKLGITAANPLAGVIKGNAATWSIDFDKLLAGTMIPLEIVGEKNGVKSDPVSASYQAPALAVEAVKVPAAPKNYKQRIVGTSAVITVQATLKAGALATDAYMFGKSLGISRSEAIVGDVLGTKVIFEVPVKASMAGKRYPITMFLSNDAGNSKPLQATLAIPAPPKVPSVPQVIPRPTTPSTVICVRSSQTRTFAGSKCPPGWSKA